MTKSKAKELAVDYLIAAVDFGYNNFSKQYTDEKGGYDDSDCEKIIEQLEIIRIKLIKMLPKTK